jgi:hypothetical protein
MVGAIMRIKLALTIGLSMAVVLVGSACAPWSTLGTGYAVTSDHHGIIVSLGTPVTVTAGTLDGRVSQVTFRWHSPPDGNGPVAWEDTVAVWQNGTAGQWNNGTTALIWYANNTHAPDELGDWGVQVFFQDSEGRDVSGVENVIKIKATSFNAIPEIPLGTIGAVGAMVFALAFFVVKKGVRPRIFSRQ